MPGETPHAISTRPLGRKVCLFQNYRHPHLQSQCQQMKGCRTGAWAMRCRAGKVHKSMSRCTSRYNSICTAPSCLFRDPICCRHHPPRCCDLADIAQSARSLTHATRTETHANASLEPTATAAVRYVKCQQVHVFIEGPHVYLPILSLKGRLHLTYSRSRGTCGMPSWMNMFRSRFPTARCRIGRVFRLLPYVTHFAFQYVHTDVVLGRDLRQLREAIRGPPSRQHGWHARQYGDECCRQFSTFACARCRIDRQQNGDMAGVHHRVQARAQKQSSGRGHRTGRILKHGRNYLGPLLRV